MSASQLLIDDPEHKAALLRRLTEEQKKTPLLQQIYLMIAFYKECSSLMSWENMVEDLENLADMAAASSAEQSSS
jgi:hypothetical protein